jgi:signal transduction histidine kinase
MQEAGRRSLFVRSGTQRVVAGVAGGIAERLEIDATVVRLAFVVLSFAGGFGIVLYLFGWLIGSEQIGSEQPSGADVSGLAEADSRHVSGPKRLFALTMVVAGTLLLLRAAGLWLGDAVVWSVALAAFGSAILWTRSDEDARGRLARLASRIPRSPAEALGERSKGRLLGGAALIVAGMATFLAANTSLSAVGNVAFAVMVTAAGLGLILGPWIFELVRQLTNERRERIRSEERAEVAAHLHDSVLQTLAMIQRSSSSQDMVTLARVQERELRAWLYGRGPVSPNGSQTLSGALDEMAGRVEQSHGVVVEAVVVGDVALDDRLRALVDAAAEATINAARHSGAPAVSVYAEVSEAGVNVYVRDEGAGFDVAKPVSDRRGIVSSIVGRMERNGGVATVSSEQGQGTEVHLAMPRRPS